MDDMDVFKARMIAWELHTLLAGSVDEWVETMTQFLDRLVTSNDLENLGHTADDVLLLVVSSVGGTGADVISFQDREGHHHFATSAHALVIEWMNWAVDNIWELLDSEERNEQLLADIGSLFQSLCEPVDRIQVMMQRERLLVARKTGIQPPRRDRKGQQQKSERNNRRRPWTAIAAAAAEEFKRRKLAQPSLTLREFCDTYAIENDVGAPTTLRKALSSNVEIWDTEGKFRRRKGQRRGN
jgi:hypothetical protein